MMLRVECPECGAKLRGPDEAAGKKIKCPKCGNSVRLPDQVDEPNYSLGGDAPPSGAFDLDEPVNPYAPPRVPVQPDELVPKKGKKKKKAKSPEDNELSGLDTVLCLLCPGLACIASIVYLIQGKGKGLKVLGLSILGSIIWNVIRFAIQNANQGGGP